MPVLPKSRWTNVPRYQIQRREITNPSGFRFSNLSFIVRILSIYTMLLNLFQSWKFSRLGDFFNRLNWFWFSQWNLNISMEDSQDVCDSVERDNSTCSTSTSSGYRLFDRQTTIHQLMGGGKGTIRFTSKPTIFFYHTK